MEVGRDRCTDGGQEEIEEKERWGGGWSRGKGRPGDKTIEEPVYDEKATFRDGPDRFDAFDRGFACQRKEKEEEKVETPRNHGNQAES